ncbi:DUF6801 domain-containing protein [Streptomyces sp. ODS05-4]|uniref:DUF6801 domain-containing protein n=1 Tax=Streptomyces sp. ODS05-4 TaxID=2944939 RepID=UPI00210E5128|nr:DUF6801 domain-containing protein [Streptomyces sp. ODS05-4]
MSSRGRSRGRAGAGGSGAPGGRRRALARTASAGAAVLVAGLVPGTSAAVDEDVRTAEAVFAYRCALPGGEHPAAVRVSAGLPQRVPAGRAVRPADVSVAVELPAAAAAELTARGVASAEGAVRLTGRLSQGEHSAELPWTQLTTPQAPVPAEGPYTVRGAGPVPEVTAGSAGVLTFATGPVTLDLLTRTADGTATTPPDLSVSCAPEPDQDTAIAEVRITPGPGAGEPSATPPAPAEPSTAPGPTAAPTGPRPPGGKPPERDPGGPGIRPPQAENGGKARQEKNADDCEEPPATPLPPVPAHGYVAGYANVLKLGAAMFVKDPGLMRVSMAKALQMHPCAGEGDPVFTLYSDATLDYRGKPQFPPARSTFLTFGFMPTTATVELLLEGKLEIATDSYFAPDFSQPQVTKATGKIRVRLSDVEVNGAPLDVGPACRTVRPMELTLTGRGGQDVNGVPYGYTVELGGPLTGTADIPPFTDCGAGGEDLDRMLTGALSGPGNFTKMTQGALCSGTQDFCPDAPRPRPERHAGAAGPTAAGRP